MASRRREDNQSLDTFSDNYSNSERNRGVGRDNETMQANRITAYGKISADATSLETLRGLFAKGDYREILVLAGRRIRGNLEEGASSVLVRKAAGIIQDIERYNMELSPQLLEFLKRPLGEIYKRAQMCRDDITKFCSGYEPGE